MSQSAPVRDVPAAVAISGVMLLSLIVAVGLLPNAGLVPASWVFVVCTAGLCGAAALVAARSFGAATATAPATAPATGVAAAPRLRPSRLFEISCLAYAAAVALSSWLAPPPVDPSVWREALWFSILAIATARAALDARVRTAAVTALVATLAVLLTAALGPRSNPETFGRFLYYPAMEQWGAYPEIGMLACIGAGAMMAVALAARRWPLRIAAAILTMFFMMILVVIQSRGAIVALAGLAAWLVVIAAIKWRERIVVFALVAAVVVTGALAWRYVDIARLKSQYGEDAAVYAVAERASHWAAAREMVRNHPLIGVGPGRFAREFANYRRDTTQPMKHAHNMVLNIAAETGLLALTPFLLIWGRLLIGSVLVRPVGHAAVVTFAIHGMVAAFFIRNLTDHFLTNVHSSLRTSLLVAILLGLAEAAIRAYRRIAA